MNSHLVTTPGPSHTCWFRSRSLLATSWSIVAGWGGRRTGHTCVSTWKQQQRNNPNSTMTRRDENTSPDNNEKTPASESTSERNPRDNPENYVLRVFYYNPKDPALMVP